MDRKEFDKLIETHQTQVINFAYRFLNNLSEAEDIAQEAFLRVYQALPRYKPQAKFSTYLYKITKNLCLNYLRRKRLVQFFSMDIAERPDLPDRKSIGAQKILEEKELKNKIYEALNKLPANQRTTVILKQYENLSLDEIGEVLNCSAGAVKSLLHRAKINLRKRLASYIEKSI